MVKSEFWTDKEIENAALAEWTGILSQLWEAIGKPVNPNQLKVYVKQLGDLPLGALDVVITQLLKDHKYANVPTIGEIWQTVRKVFATDDPEEIRGQLSREWLVYFSATPPRVTNGGR